MEEPRKILEIAQKDSGVAKKDFGESSSRMRNVGENLSSKEKFGKSLVTKRNSEEE